MYNVVLYVHVLALVYWLGGDLGTFLSSRHVLRSELGVESRQTAFNILMECDMGPRLAMPIILGSGCHLAALRWPSLIPEATALVGWLLVLVWVGLIAALHKSACRDQIESFNSIFPIRKHVRAFWHKIDLLFQA